MLSVKYNAAMPTEVQIYQYLYCYKVSLFDLGCN